MWLFFRPFDTVFFSSGRPFSMGVDSWTEGIFPPNPSTIAGALRSYLILSRGTVSDFYNRGYDDVGRITVDEKGEKHFSPGTMRIKGPLVFNEKFKIALFPIPLDLVVTKEKQKRQFKDSHHRSLYTLEFLKKPDFVVYPDDKPSHILWWRGKEQVENVQGFISDIGMESYLNGEIEIGEFLERGEVFVFENKIGIARDRIANVTREGHLYRIPMMRLNNEIGFLVEVTNLSMDDGKGVSCLGAERKVAQLKQVDVSNNLFRTNKGNFSLNNGLFKIYLSTPAIFEKGWIPNWLDENTLEGEKNGLRLRLEACVVGKPIKVGGWDLANEKPKPVFRAVPAGSVYYFRVINGKIEPDLVLRTFHFNTISDVLSEEGFGLSFVGSVKT